jgi:transposase
MDKSGKIFYHRNMRNDFEIFKRTMEPYLPSMAVGVESSAYYYWLCDACHQEGIEFYLGHALYMKAVSGKKKKNDRIDSKTVTDLMRGNLFPLAYAYPKEMRATRDLLRRRHRFVSLRAEAYSHIQLVFTQHGILDISPKDVKSKPTRRSLVQKLDESVIELNIMIVKLSTSYLPHLVLVIC